MTDLGMCMFQVHEDKMSMRLLRRYQSSTLAMKVADEWFRSKEQDDADV